MALRAFSKVIFRGARAAFDGLLHRSEAAAPAVRLPKQIQAAKKLANFKATGQQVVNKDNYWIRNFAWKTLAADLRRRAGWQINGIANKGIGAGQRWLLFPAYAFVGLAFNTGQQPNLSAEEIDQELSTTTKHIKNMFGPGLKTASVQCEGGTEECRSGRLIARGKRAAVYRVETSKQHQSSESSLVDSVVRDVSCEEVVSEAAQSAHAQQHTPAPAPPAPARDLHTNTDITLQCEETVSAEKTSNMTIKFATSDGRQFDVQLQICPVSASRPVSVTNVSVDGQLITTSGEVGSVGVETLLQDAMQDVQSRTSPCREAAAQPTPAPPQQHQGTSQVAEVSQLRESPSIEVISDGDLVQCGNLGQRWRDGDDMKAGRVEIAVEEPDFETRISVAWDLAAAKYLPFTSLDSDIEIIDDTLELSMDQQTTENAWAQDPIYLDDMQEDPLADLDFINDREAVSYLNNEHEGSYLVMTYFPYQEEMTSLSLPDTGENLWDMYDELFCNSLKNLVTGACEEAVDDVTESSMKLVSMATEDDTVIVHTHASMDARLTLNSDVREDMDTHTRPPPQPNIHTGGSGDPLTYSEYHDAMPNTPQADECGIWLNRWPSDRTMDAHPNIARPHFMSAHDERSQTQTRYDCTLEERLSRGVPSLLESVAIFTQITEAVAHLQSEGFIYRDMQTCDVQLVGPAKWPHVVLVDSGGRIYDACGPKHLSYRDAVIHWTGDCSAIQPVQPPSSLSNAGEGDRRQIMADLASMACHVFAGTRTSRTGQQENNMSLPSHIPGIFQHLIHALLQPDAYKKFDARLLCCILHLLLWCPQRYFVQEQPRHSKHQVAQWLCTFAATTWMKKSAMCRESWVTMVPQQETVRLQLKCNFLSDLDTTRLHTALNYILNNIKK